MHADSRQELAAAALPILTYHNVDAAPPGATHRGLYLRPSQFRLQMRMLRQLGYRGVSMSEGLPFLLGEKQGKVAVLTFDDGYRDNLDHALPILREFGFTATCYLVADCIGSYNRWDADLLKVKKPLMDTAALRQWQQGGMEFGSHTRSHPHLPRLGAEVLHSEIADSKRYLESLLGCAMEHFCYPYGDYDENCVAAVRAAGYKTAVTTTRGRVRRGDSLLALRRCGNSGKKSALVFFGRALTWSF